MKISTIKSLVMLLILIVASSGSLLAQYKPQGGKIGGSIIDAEKKPIEFATVALKLAKDSSLIKTVVTDVAGNYTFDNIPAGQYIINARMFNYKEAYSKTVIIDGQTVKTETLQLSADVKTLKEVTVTAQRPLVERKMDRLVVNVSNSSLATGSTALELLQKSPGVTVDQEDNIAMQGKKGVLIMLDGKQTYMSNKDVANLLKNMQSSDIESIELITTPSAKFEASGNSGIINIKTKKSKLIGTNGTLTSGAGLGKNYRLNEGISLNHRNEHINVFGNFNYSFNKNEYSTDIDRLSAGAVPTYFTQTTNQLRKRNNYNFKAGIDIFLNKKSTLGFLANGYINKGADMLNSNTLIGKTPSVTDSSLLAVNPGNKKYQNFSYNANYKLSIDSLGQEFSADADYSRYNGKDITDYNSYFFNKDGSVMKDPTFIKNTMPSLINIKAFKVDYTKPINKTMKLEAGLKASWVTTDNDFKFEQLLNSQWVNNLQRSNHFIYDENVNAAYVNFNKQFKSTGVQVGLRAEQTNSKGNLVTESKVVKRNYLNFFPSVFVNQALAKNHDLSFSYSRRIDRPGYDDLNPFIYFLDQYTYQKGNPFLNPQLTHSFEMAYVFKKTYSLSINYSRINDVITHIILPDPAKKALFATNENLDKQVNYGLNLNVPVTIVKWWNTSNNLSVFNMGFTSADLQGQLLKAGKTVYQFNTQHTFTINKFLRAELSGNFNSRMIYGTFNIGEQHSIDAGLNANLMNKKLNVKLAMSDIFNTNRSNITSVYSGLSYTVRERWESRMTRLTLSYSFGKQEVKAARKRATGTESEQSRMKN